MRRQIDDEVMRRERVSTATYIRKINRVAQVKRKKGTRNGKQRNETMNNRKVSFSGLSSLLHLPRVYCVYTFVVKKRRTNSLCMEAQTVFAAKFSFVMARLFTRVSMTSRRASHARSSKYEAREFLSN
jgi:hypothetical protein